MAKALRNLQIFRNDAVITGKTASQIKTLIESALVANQLELSDGEPISIRYSEGGNIKSLFGVAYIRGGTKTVLWNDSAIAISTEPEENSFITLNHTEDTEGNVTLSVAYTAVNLENADENNDGLATALDVKNYIDALPHDTYTIVKKETAESNYFATYELQDGDGAKVGESINIPKDFLVKSGQVKTVTTEDDPYEGAQVGDKYIEFIINTVDGSATGETMRIPVNDLVDVYTGGNGIELGEDNSISLKYTNDGHNVTFGFDTDGKFYADAVDTTYEAGENITITGDTNVIAVKISEEEGNSITSDENGLYATDTTYTGSNSIAISSDNEISVKISNHAGNIIGVDENGIWAVQGASTTITDVKVIKNGTTETKYYTVDENHKIIEFTPESTEGVMSIAPGTKKILVATSDNNINGDVLPETDDTYVNGGELIDIPANEEAGTTAKTVIRLSYNTSITTEDIDVTALVNTAHTVVTGETEITGANTDYVYVKATTNDNAVTLSSGVKVVGFADVTEDNNGLATTLEVKNYVDNHQTVVEAGDDTVTVEASDNENGGKTYTITANIPEAVGATITTNDTTPYKDLTVTQDGIVNQDMVDVIKTYVDNYDCGKFDANFQIQSEPSQD